MVTAESAYSEVVENLQAAAFALARIGESSERVVSAGNESSMTRVPFRVSTYHAGLTCRFIESAEAVITVFKARHYAATITLTQSVMTTTAALWQLYLRVDSSIKRNDMRHLESYLVRIFAAEAGARSARASDAANVMRFIQQVDADYPLFQRNCEELFQFDQPEWFGSGQLYAERERERFSLEFRPRMSEADAPIGLMGSVLKFTVLAYEHYDRELTRLMPRLASLDERGDRDDAVPADWLGTAGGWIAAQRGSS